MQIYPYSLLSNENSAGLKMMGKGGFGEVYEASWRPTVDEVPSDAAAEHTVSRKAGLRPKLHVAVKFFNPRMTSKADIEAELRAMRKFRHPNCVQFHGITHHPDYGAGMVPGVCEPSQFGNLDMKTHTFYYRTHARTHITHIIRIVCSVFCFYSSELHAAPKVW